MVRLERVLSHSDPPEEKRVHAVLLDFFLPPAVAFQLVWPILAFVCISAHQVGDPVLGRFQTLGALLLDKR